MQRRLLASIGRDQTQRRGSTLIVVCILLGIMMIAVAFSIDFARIQLTQLELQSAADLSSRAGAEALSRGVGDPNDLALTDASIRDEILMVARLNTINGSAADLDVNDITFGRAVTGADGMLSFNATPSGSVTSVTDSVRVSPGIENYPITFGKFVGREQIDLATQAAAMVQERDMVVVLDRSTSMTSRDAGTIDIADYPANLLALEQDLWSTNDFYHPDCDPSLFRGNQANPKKPARDVSVEIDDTNVNLTRLQALRIAVLTFLNEIEASKGHEQLGLSTYGTIANAADEGQLVMGGNSYDINAGLSEQERIQIIGAGETEDPQATDQKYASALEDEASEYAGFKLNYLAMRWSHATHIVDGLDKGNDILFGPGARALATPVLILMTDGKHNKAGHPLVKAKALKEAHPEMLIYTVSFGDGADKDLMAQIAEAGGGTHSHATTVAQLVEVFRDLGQNAGVTLIE